MFRVFAHIYNISKEKNKQKEKINNLTKKLEELSSKGD